MTISYDNLPICITGDRAKAISSGSLFGGIIPRGRDVKNLSGPACLLLQIVDGDDVALTLDFNGDLFPDFATSEGISPLMLAAGRGNLAAVQTLASHPLVNINRRTPEGLTALHLAALCGHAETVTLLLKRGADHAQADNHGKTAADLAANDAVSEAFASFRANPGARSRLAGHSAVFQRQQKTDTGAARQDTINNPNPVAARAGKALKNELDFLAALNDRQISRGALRKALDPNTTTAEDFAAAFEQYKSRVMPSFWDSMVVEAAGADNLPVLEFLYANHPLPKVKVLNNAMEWAVRSGDFPHVVGHLVRLGAAPAAVLPDLLSADKIYQIAIQKRRLLSFGQMAIWGGSFASEAELDRCAVMDCSVSDDYAKIGVMADLLPKRGQLQKKSASVIRRELSRAVTKGHLTDGVIAYTAGIGRSSFFHPRVDFEPDDICDLVALAIKKKSFGFAKEVYRSTKGIGVYRDYLLSAVKEQIDPHDAENTDALSCLRQIENNLPLKAYSEPKKASYGTFSTGPR